MQHHTACLGEHHDLAPRLVILHAAVSLHNVVDAKHPADLDFEGPPRDLVAQLRQGGVYEIVGPPRVGCQVYTCGADVRARAWFSLTGLQPRQCTTKWMTA